jgi:hypothetical protein
MRGTILTAGLCFITVAAIVGGLAPQFWPGIHQSTTAGIALATGVLVAVAMAVVLAQDEVSP